VDIPPEAERLSWLLWRLKSCIFARVDTEISGEGRSGKVGDKLDWEANGDSVDVAEAACERNPKRECLSLGLLSPHPPASPGTKLALDLPSVSEVLQEPGRGPNERSRESVRGSIHEVW
jgi:hypothetical protein